jgi:hypothetical protein
MNNISTGLQLMALNLAPEDPNQELIQRLPGLRSPGRIDEIGPVLLTSH